MPELPEVETVLRELSPVLQGQKITALELRRPNLRYPFHPEMRARLVGSDVARVRRRGKNLIVTIDAPIETHVVWHLGMSGQVLIFTDQTQKAPMDKHDHVVLTLASGAQVRYRDARRFGYMKLLLGADPETVLKLGPDANAKGLTVAQLHRRISQHRQAIKTVLMDQSVVAGLGNIYALEILHRIGMHPQHPAAAITQAACARLLPEMRRVLEEAIASGGSSLRDHVRTNGELGYFQHKFQVYGRADQPCYRCQGQVQLLRQNGRSSFLCPTCQPLPEEPARLSN